MRIMQRWEEGKAEVNRLGLMMKEARRLEDFVKSLTDKELQEKSFVEFGLKEA